MTELEPEKPLFETRLAAPDGQVRPLLLVFTPGSTGAWQGLHFYCANADVLRHVTSQLLRAGVPTGTEFRVLHTHIRVC